MPGRVGSCRVGRSPIRFFDLILNNALALRASQKKHQQHPDLLMLVLLLAWSSRKGMPALPAIFQIHGERPRSNVVS